MNLTPTSKHLKPSNTQLSTILLDNLSSPSIKTITIQTKPTPQLLDIYRWRTQTQFPIAKIKSLQLSPLKSSQNNHSEFSSLTITFEQLPHTLADIDQLPLFKILYLLKETLIGLQRLFSKFGPFLLTQRMIFIDHLGKVKVWLNQKIPLNHFQTTHLNQSQFLAHLYPIFNTKTLPSKQTTAFFTALQNTHSFFSALDYIETFLDKQKIKVLTSCKIQPSSNPSNSMEKKHKQNHLNMTMTKKPHFLTNFELTSSKQDSLTNSKKEIGTSLKFFPPKNRFSKPQMKISGDTAAESQKNIKSSNDCGGQFSPVIFSTKTIKQKRLFNSDKSQKIQSKVVNSERKFSHAIQQTPSIEIHAPKESRQPNSQKDVLNEISESMTFCDENGKASRSSSVDNKEKLIEKKKEVFNFNGWQLKVNSLFSNDSEFQKSFCDRNAKPIARRDPVKLELLDKCATNMCESFMGGEDSNGFHY